MDSILALSWDMPLVRCNLCYIFFYYIFAFTRKRKEKEFLISIGLTQHDLYATGDCHEVIKMLDLKLYNTPLFKLHGKYFNLMKQYVEDVTNHSHAFLRR